MKARSRWELALRQLDDNEVMVGCLLMIVVVMVMVLVMTIMMTMVLMMLLTPLRCHRYHITNCISTLQLSVNLDFKVVTCEPYYFTFPQMCKRNAQINFININ